ncbi:hypothetical protein FGE12_07930 [Aggregicoccus sp. 17bor-14]|uniref:hypothetical protein n=1 Tax=Myxococcaceae TaxID=31 RepID=UPI00129C1D5E|nr:MULTISPECIES: hypothetical protein [Myxococcaceae]MBF5042325.1 hypothetical protein [Simulacricoccus sp. 17bor-14]MRI88099.1 hypothetical protein [Aggregicoccus sp. 17bor-14]
MTETRLSSAMTYVTKFVLPIVGVAAGSIWVWLLWFHEDGWQLNRPSLGFRALFTALMLLSVSLSWVFTRQLKAVFLVEGGLRVSDFREEVFIPFEDIAEVRERKLSKHRDIRLVLRQPCRFGSRIRFIPYTQHFLLFGDHPVATLLRERAGLVAPSAS